MNIIEQCREAIAKFQREWKIERSRATHQNKREAQRTKKNDIAERMQDEGTIMKKQALQKNMKIT